MADDVSSGRSERYPFVIEDLLGVPETLGYQTTIFADRTETVLDVDARHANRNGRVHGGVHATMLDAALGFAASDAFRRGNEARGAADEGWDVPVLTLALSVNFVGATEGNRLTATGRVDRAGGSIAFASGEVRDENDALLATGTATFKRTRSRGSR